MLLLPLNPTTVNLTAVAPVGLSPASATVRVFSIVSGSEVNSLAATALVNVYDTVWRFLWSPGSLGVGNYIAYYRFLDGGSNLLAAATDDLVVSYELTLLRQVATNRVKLSTSSIQQTWYADDQVTTIITKNCLDNNGNPSATNVFEEHP
jgi:hypothetical protein